MSKRIFIGISNTAGYGSRLVRGFRKSGIEADLYVTSEHPFKYNNDYSFQIKQFSSIWLKRIYARIFFFKSLLKYDAFIFFSGQPLLKNFSDFKFYRLLNKKTMMIFLGCDIQQPELTFRSDIPFSSCHNCTQKYKDFVHCVPEKKIIRTKTIENLTDFIVSHIAISDSLKKEYIKIVQPINIEDFPDIVPETGNEVPVILHAPSDFGYKGTQHLISAIEKLKNEFKFEFRLINNVTIKELYNEILKSDLVVDQLIQGWYGMLPLEAMMFKKPVVCYLREDVVKELPSDCPIINANPDTIYDVLKQFLMNRDRWKQIGEKGRNYVEKYHNAKTVAETYAGMLLNKS